VYYNCVKFHKNSISSLVGVALTRYMPPLLFVKVYLELSPLKEYRCSLKFRRGDKSTYTFTKRGVVYLVSATPPKRVIGVL
jgi:hypothetical protein